LRTFQILCKRHRRRYERECTSACRKRIPRRMALEDGGKSVQFGYAQKKNSRRVLGIEGRNILRENA
jgi:hypothetical protein